MEYSQATFQTDKQSETINIPHHITSDEYAGQEHDIRARRDKS